MSNTSTPELHLAVALADCGWHPAAWREPDARPRDLLTGEYWTDLVTEAERGLADLVTVEDSLGLQSSSPFRPDARTDQVRGRLDAVLIANRLGPVTRHIGIMPSQVVTHTEPFHASKAIATLDYVSTGRAGVQLRTSGRGQDAALFGRRTIGEFDRDAPGIDDTGPLADLFDEAADYAEVLRRLWDSWEDDAEIRDVATGRFVDIGKLHYIDFDGASFSVRGPSITPRPPQGRPPIAVLAHRTVAYRLAGRAADLVFVTPADDADAAGILGRVRDEQDRAGRGAEPVHVLGDVVVFLDSDAGAARERKARLDDRLGRELVSDAHVLVGTPAELADLVLGWRAAGLSGVRLRPGALPHDLHRITRDLVPELQRRGAFRTAYASDTLRGHLGLARPANRYVNA
ncbi:MAG: LLM class flavin-dependent oxidoreductase [Pseudonocardia sp.]|nr:LLM class flavin-dependent oxidoreductase [Pseudonocardia sp.]